MGRVVRLKGREGMYVRWTDGAGRRRHAKANGSYADARAMLRELEDKAQRDRLDLPEVLKEKPLADLARAWREHLTLSRRRPSTWRLYKLGLEEVFRWLRQRGSPLERASGIRREDLMTYAAEKLDQPASPRTVDMLKAPQNG